MNNHMIDIRIPAYNEERYIQGALEALAEQTYPYFQVTIHDNASTDRTREICREFSRRDSRFRLRTNFTNIGREMNGLRCLHSVERDFFMLRSANDLLAPNSLEKLMEVMQSDPKVGLVYAGAHEIDETGRVTALVPDAMLYDTDVTDILGSARTVMSRYAFSMPLYGLMRTSVFDRCRIKPFNYGNDHILVCEIALYSSLRCVREPLFSFRSPAIKPRNWFEDVSSKAAAQVEEADRKVDPSSGFFPLEQHLPFIHMAHGHIEMFTKAQIDHHLKEPLCALARDIFLNRFKPFIQVELKLYAQHLTEILNHLQSGEIQFDPIEKSYFLRRTLTELNKVSLVIPSPEILRAERQAVMAAIERG